MDTAECYRTVRARMIELARTLTEEQRTTPVPACPAWTVQDTYAHLAGVCAEVLARALTGRATDNDTARQVADRKGLALEEIVAEWTGLAPRIDVEMSGPQGSSYGLLAADVWSHEQDVRAALGLPIDRADPTVGAIAAFIAERFDRSWRKRGLDGAVRVITVEGGDRRIGEGEPAATLSTSDYELSRMLIGRRTLGQMRAADWTGDPTPYLDRLHLFGPPEADLVD